MQELNEIIKEFSKEIQKVQTGLCQCALTRDPSGKLVYTLATSDPEKTIRGFILLDKAVKKVFGEQEIGVPR